MFGLAQCEGSKNIANRMTQEDLYHVLNSVVPGQFDFLYLRVDFANGNNLGYAFANFTSSAALLKFAQAKLGTHWFPNHSSKLVQMAFADHQGLPQLVQNFRECFFRAAKLALHIDR